MKCYHLYLPDSRYGLHDCTWLNFQMSICLKQQPNIALMHPIHILVKEDIFVEKWKEENKINFVED